MVLPLEDLTLSRKKYFIGSTIDGCEVAFMNEGNGEFANFRICGKLT